MRQERGPYEENWLQDRRVTTAVSPRCQVGRRAKVYAHLQLLEVSQVLAARGAESLPLLCSSANSPLESLMRSHLYVLSRIRPTGHRPDFIHHRKLSVLVLVELGCNKSER